ncbi:hypothetical protein IKW75_00095, partial [Candidatus Saccharibacteria bacterium]|nr:hypothetical protein [Candidatus Saccharibacteria bacterium]
APLLLIYNVSVLLQVAKLILWVGLLGYGIWGVVTDSVNWRLLIIPVAIYLVFEVLYAVWMLKICADEFSSSSC